LSETVLDPIAWKRASSCSEHLGARVEANEARARVEREQ
jgi:hypothetical protein